MKKIVLILVLLLLLGGGGAGAYFFLFRAPDKTAEAPPPPPQLGEVVEIEPITIPVIRRGKVSKVVTYRVAVELPPKTPLDEIRPHLPRLQDASLTLLASLAAFDWPDGAAVDPDVAKARLLQRFREIAPAEIVAAVLIRDIVERPA